MPRDGGPDLDTLFLSRVRLGVMAALAGAEEMDFTALRETVDTTDGNLGAHLRKLEDAGMVASKKRFIARKPNTSYRLTPAGRRAFRGYVEQLADILDLETKSGSD